MPNRPIWKMIEHKTPVTAKEQDTVAEAARLMKERKVGAVVVLRKDRVAGIFTERDAISRVLAEGLDPAHTKLSKVMTQNPKTIAPEKPFAHALVLMRDNGFRHVPVVAGGRLVGVVSLRDALGTELRELEADMIQREDAASSLY